MKEKDMQKIASFIDQSFKGDAIQTDVQDFNNSFSKIHYSFDTAD
jgi:hypothetical protein